MKNKIQFLLLLLTVPFFSFSQSMLKPSDIAWIYMTSIPSFCNTIDIYELEVLPTYGPVSYSFSVLEWSGDIEGGGFSSGSFTKTKVRFTKTGKCVVKAKLNIYGGGLGIGEISLEVDVKDPVLSGRDYFSFGEQVTYKITDFPRDPTIVNWSVSDGLRIVSGQGTSEIVVESAKNTTNLNETVSAYLLGSMSRLNLNQKVSIYPGNAPIKISRESSSNTFIVEEEQTAGLVLNSNSRNSSLIQYELYNQMSGTLLEKGSVDKNGGMLDFNRMQKGLYIINFITDSNKKQSHKIIIR